MLTIEVKKLGGFMDWMQLIEIMSSIALVVVTVGLLVSTNMYRKATEEMAKDSTRRTRIDLKRDNALEFDTQVGRSRPTASKQIYTRHCRKLSRTFRRRVVKNLFEKSKLISESCHFMGKCAQNRLILPLKWQKMTVSPATSSKV